MHGWAWSGILAGLLVGGGAGSVRAAAISEVWQSAFAQQAYDGSAITVPALVEVSGLTADQTPQLILLNAQTSASRRGTVLLSATLGGSAAVRLLVDGVWPTTPLGPQPVPADAITHVAADQELSFVQPVTLVLLSAPVSSLDSNAIVGSYAQLVNLAAAAHADVLDMITIVPDGKAYAAWSDEPVLMTPSATAQVIARPSTAVGAASATLSDAGGPTYLVGQPTPAGRLTDVDPPYPLNPGFANPSWSAAETPEPGAGALWLAAATALGAVAGRQRRRPSRWQSAGSGLL